MIFLGFPTDLACVGFELLALDFDFDFGFAVLNMDTPA